MADTTSIKTYDYIVVGGGTSGLVVASRLSEDPQISVLVIEAGGDQSQDPFVNTPGFMGALYGKEEYDWNFSSVPQVSRNIAGWFLLIRDLIWLTTRIFRNH